jgi:2-keto-4-pentenoate hydratase
MTAPYIQKLVAERGGAQFAIGCRTDSEKEASLLQIPLQMQQNDNPEDGARGMGCPGAPRAARAALRPGSFIAPMQQTCEFT